MLAMDRGATFEEFKVQPSDQIVFEIRRTSEVLEVAPDLTFSKEAMEALDEQIRLFIGARVIARWEKTGEPPSYLSIDLKVTAA